MATDFIADILGEIDLRERTLSSATATATVTGSGSGLSGLLSGYVSAYGTAPSRRMLSLNPVAVATRQDRN